MFAFLAATLIILFSSYFLSYKEIALAVDGKQHKVITRSATVAEFLASQNIYYSPHDDVKPDPTTILVPGTRVVVRHALPIVVKINGRSQLLMAYSCTVDTLLRALGVKTKGDVIVTPAGSSRLTAGMTVAVKILDRRLETIETPLAYDNKRVDDPSLLKGNTKLASKGEPGLRRKVIEHIWAGNHEIESRVQSDIIVKSPVAEIVKIGTKLPQIAAVPAASPAISGTVSRGDRSMSMVATGYAAGDGGGAGSRTATGTGVYKGIVAVDPRVIPLGTRLFIDGYGPAIAADTGGAIKGNRVDLAFGSVAEANNWGRRTVVVHILQ